MNKLSYLRAAADGELLFKLLNLNQPATSRLLAKD